MSALLELADRIEAAEGPDADLFWEAWRTCFPKPSEIWAVLGETWTDEYTDWQERQMFWSCFIDADAWLDAALTLVPEGWTDVRQHQSRMTDGSVRCYAAIEFDLSDMCLTAEGMAAATPALALCAAALRARAAQ